MPRQIRRVRAHSSRRFGGGEPCLVGDIAVCRNPPPDAATSARTFHLLVFASAISASFQLSNHRRGSRPTRASGTMCAFERQQCEFAAFRAAVRAIIGDVGIRFVARTAVPYLTGAAA